MSQAKISKRSSLLSQDSVVIPAAKPSAAKPSARSTKKERRREQGQRLQALLRQKQANGSIVRKKGVSKTTKG
jgi:hypothetical protein